MAEWLVEQGIGETRAILVHDGAILAARLHWPGYLAARQVENAVLIARHAGASRGTARFASGEEALVDKLPRNAAQGAALMLEITRAAMGEGRRIKLAQARPTARPPCPAPALIDILKSTGKPVRIVPRFPAGCWENIAEQAFSRAIDFDGGSLLLCPTPAMTLIDVDGALPPRQLALAAVPAIAGAIRQLDLAGSIGIDFPTVQDKADRRAVDQALASALDGWPHEHTAINGFGFVQLVARLERPSILHQISQNRVSAAARLLLRQGEGVAAPGAILLTCHPALQARLRAEWLEQLARRTGRQIRIETDPALALEGGFAQSVAL